MNRITADNLIYDSQETQPAKRIAAFGARYQQIVANKPLHAHIAKSDVVRPPKRTRQLGQRDILVGFFTDKINAINTKDGRKLFAYSYINKKLTARFGTDISWLYKLQTECLEAEANGIPFTAIFWSKVNKK